MPIYEFKCCKCEEFFEVITTGSSKDSNDDNKCPKCSSTEFERVLSKTNYILSNASSNGTSGVSKQERNCSQGSCSTYTIAGE